MKKSLMKLGLGYDLENIQHRKYGISIILNTTNKWLTKITSIALQFTPNFIFHSIEYATDKLSLKSAVKHNRVELVKILLVDGRTDPTVDDSEVLRLAAEYGYYEIVELLLADGRADPGAKNSNALYQAARHGHDKIVHLLLRDHRVNPAANQCEAFRWAVINGCIATIKVFLRDVRINPGADNNFALTYSIEDKNDKIVQLLLDDGRINPALHNDAALCSAITKGHYPTVSALLNDARVTLNNYMTSYNRDVFELLAIHRAAAQNNLNQLNRLLTVNPEITNHIAENLLKFIQRYPAVANALHSQSPENIAFKEVFFKLTSHQFLSLILSKIAALHQYHLPNDILHLICNHMHSAFTPYAQQICQGNLSVDSVTLFNKSRTFSF